MGLRVVLDSGGVCVICPINIEVRRKKFTFPFFLLSYASSSSHSHSRFSLSWNSVTGNDGFRFGFDFLIIVVSPSIFHFGKTVGTDAN